MSIYYTIGYVSITLIVVGILVNVLLRVQDRVWAQEIKDRNAAHAIRLIEHYRKLDALKK